MDNIGNVSVRRWKLSVIFHFRSTLRQYLFNFYSRFRTLFHTEVRSVGTRRFLLFSESVTVEIWSNRNLLQIHAILIFHDANRRLHGANIMMPDDAFDKQNPSKSIVRTINTNGALIFAHALIVQ